MTPKTTALPAVIPREARRQLAHYLGAVEATEQELRDALLLVAERHKSNFEVSRGATTLAIWSTQHLGWLTELTNAFGSIAYQHATSLRAVLLRESHTGVTAELADVCDLAVLVQHAEMLWTVLVQGARELREDRLLDVASRARGQSRRQLAWLRTIVEHEAPDAIAVARDEPPARIAPSAEARAQRASRNSPRPRALG